MMEQVIDIMFAVLVVSIFVWLLRGASSAASGDSVIDPNDARQIGTLVGLMGGSVADAAVAQFALRRFEEEHGRKATVRDMGIVAGMMRGRR